MTEEIINTEEENLEDQVTLTPEEARASDGGWRPQEEWQGEEDEWIDARTFNKNGEFMDRIKSQTSQLRGQDKKISKLETSIQNLAEHNKKIDEVAFKKALNELKGLKRDALDIGDNDQVVEIDDQINDLKSIQKEADQPNIEEPQENINPEVVDWIEQNNWYKTDTMLRGAADALTLEIVQAYPELRNSPSEVLKKVEVRMKEEFPSKFGKTTRRGSVQTVSEPGQADETNRSKGSGKKFTSKHLNEMQMQMGKTFVETGAMKNLNEYASQLAEIGELDAQKGA